MSPSNAGVTLTAFDPARGGPVEHELPLASPGDHARMTLKRVPGASGLHLRFAQPDGAVHRMEIPCDADTSLDVLVSTLADGGLVARSPGRPVYTLPSEPAFGPESPDWEGGPVPPLVPPAQADVLDLAILVDATTRRWFEESGKVTSGPLLAETDAWGKVVETLLDVVEGLCADAEVVRTVVLAFADEAPTRDVPKELKPRFLLHPADVADRQLLEREPEDLQRALLGVPGSSGADFVDALGEGLRAVERLNWSPEARRMLVLFGDSPGYSVLDPAPRGADARVRTVDVDTEVHRLHRRGIEVATIHASPRRELGLYDPGTRSERLLRHAREQYRRLASSAAYATGLDGLVVRAFTDTLRTTRTALARGPTWPVLVGSPARVAAEAARRFMG